VLYTVPEECERLRVSRVHLYGMLKAGKITPFRLERRVKHPGE
jgi:predicted site-specific integrase-resolvase